jgi:CMP-N-acetylneuraminic acid synthetase
MAPSLQKYYSTAALSIPLPDMAKNTPASTAEVATADKMAVTAGAGAGGNSPGMAQPAWQSNQSVQQGTPSSADKMAVTAGAGAGGNSPGMAQPAWQSNQSVQQGAAFQNVYAAPQASIDSNLNHLSEKQSAGLAIPAQVDSADVDDFEFSDFESAAVDPAQSIKLNAGPSTVSLSSQSKDDATVSENVTGQVTHTQTSDLDFDFDDFSAPSNPPAVVSERDSHSHAGPIVASATSDAPIIAAAVVTPAVPVKASVISGVGASPNINMSFFDDLIEGDKQQQEEAEEWEEFAGGKEEDTSKTVEEDGTVNPFEAFNSGEADKKSSSPPAPIQLENTNRQSPPTVALMNLEPHARSLPSLAFDDFGYPAEIASKPSTTIVNDDVAVTPITFPAFEDEDFGDFEEAEAAQPVIPKVELPMFSANFSIKPPAPSSSNRDSRFDTMDLLSMDDDPPLPMPSLPLFSGFQENFAASNLAATSSISTLLKVGQQNSSSGDTSAEAFSPSPSPAPSPAVTHLLDLDTVSFNPTERSSKAAPLTISTLEQLAVSLTSRDYYEEAYCCLQKASLLKTTDRLNEDKMVAIDADDLEAAVTIKKKLVTLKASLAALGDESRWTAAAASKRPGESLADLVDLVCAIDPSKRDWAQQLLLLIPPMSSKRVQGQVQDIEDLVAKALSVKRSLRMAIAVSTTHTKHSQYWLLLLNHVSSAVQNTSNIMDAYNRLSGADKESVLACERMKIFIAGSLKIAELGVWVSASCVECVVHEAVAERVVVQCHVFVRAAAAMWKGATKVRLDRSSRHTDDQLNFTCLMLT